ncbi:transglycosylase SLT domain-containing protein [Alicyclobacillus tolerans]|uniref:transglycosylase SLT domain-containing protein n=1 Tax=Alicyclobacillus tolerans TaxID=90970 RepID=UPI001F2C84FB|nr:transglycosylase SLT domain-containing protein [Alicyclobacillus tolerans]MCF8564379.1 transglycosylase SLT domain-containing protein [Alicyclobacillus tolerans]
MTYLPANQVAHYAYDAGFRGNSLVTAVAVADAESTFDTSAIGPGDMCIGLWQVNKVHDEANPSALFEPSYSARMAYSISNQGTNWSAWTAYTNGSYKRYWSIAETAVRTMAQPTYSHLNVHVNGQSFPAIAVKNTTYLLWTALKKWDIPYRYLGNGKFSINGRAVQGIVYEGNTYLNWSSIPYIKVIKINGEFNFTDSH